MVPTNKQSTLWSNVKMERWELANLLGRYGYLVKFHLQASQLSSAFSTRWGADELMGGSESAIFWCRLAGSLVESDSKGNEKIHTLEVRAQQMYGKFDDARTESWGEICLAMRLGALAGKDWSRDAPSRLLSSKINWTWLDERVGEEIAARAAIADALKAPGSTNMASWLKSLGYQWSSGRARRYFSEAIALSRARTGQEKYENASADALRVILASCPDAGSLDMGQGAYWSWVALRPDMASAFLERGANLAALPNIKESLEEEWSKPFERRLSLSTLSPDRKSSTLATAMAAWESALLSSELSMSSLDCTLEQRGPRL